MSVFAKKDRPASNLPCGRPTGPSRNPTTSFLTGQNLSAHWKIRAIKHTTKKETIILEAESTFTIILFPVNRTLKSICFHLQSKATAVRVCVLGDFMRYLYSTARPFANKKDTVCAVVEYKIYDKCSYLLSESLGVSSLLLITHSQKLMKHQDWKINNCVL